MKPYFERDGIRLFHGDALEVLHEIDLPRPLVTITDPVWPNGARAFPLIDSWGLWDRAAPVLAAKSNRMVVILGCDSDPRFLGSVPKGYGFVRVCKLRYPAPSYKQPILIDFDVAYVFGEKFENGDGMHRLLPGECRGRQAVGKQRWQKRGGGHAAVLTSKAPGHPCPRNPDHMLWLVENFTRPGDLVLDPFSGQGTTLWACRELGRKGVGIEIEERFVERAARSLDQGLLFAQSSEPTYESVAKEHGLRVEEVVEQLAREKQAEEQIADRLGLCPLPPRTQEPGQGSQP